MSGSEAVIPFNYTEPQKVYSGRKTATRRTKTYGAKAGMKMRAVFRSYNIVDLQITAVYNQKLEDMSEEDAEREGYGCLHAFKAAWVEIHPQQGWDPEQNVWVIEWKKPK